MIRIPRFILLLPAVAAFCATVEAGVSSRMSSRFLARGEMATLEVVLDGERPKTVPLVRTSPDISLRLLSLEPQRSGVPGRFNEFAYIYELSSYKVGDHVIPPIEVETASGTDRTEPLQFRVFNPDDLVWDETMAGTVPFRYASSFLSMNPSPYEGETIPVEIKLYVPSELFFDDWGIPDLERDGLTAWRFQPSRARGQVNLLGRPFTAISYPSTLTPTRTGQIGIGPAKIRLISIQAVTDFGRMRRIPVEANVDIPKLTLESKALPEGAPEGFDNAVGDFRIATRSPSTEIAEGDPAPVEITVTGTGNLDSLRPPKPITSDGWKLYDATREQRGDERREISGTVKFHQFLRPLQIQSSIPSFSLAYFDPVTATYKTATSDPIPLRMTPAAAVPGSMSNVTPAADVPLERMTDILGLLQPASLTMEPRRGLPGWAWHAIGGLLALALVIKALWMRLAPRMHQDPDAEARKRELRELEKLQAGDPRSFLMSAGRFVERWMGETAPDAARQVLAERDAACFRSDLPAGFELGAKRRNEILRTLRRGVSAIAVAAVFLTAGTARAAGEDTAEQARAAFDEGRFDDAAALWLGAGPYESLAPATLYNIGNACYRAGSPGEAALYYRRALVRDPYHAESMQNLRFIERKYGSISVHRPEYQDLLAKLPLHFWQGTFWAGAWLGVLAVLVFPATRPAAKVRVAAISALLAAPLLMVSGGFGWHYFPEDAVFASLSRQAVVISEDVVVHADAARTSPEVIDAPPGSLCEVLRDSGRWSYISFANQTRGWVPSSAIQRVRPKETPKPPTLRKPKADGKSA